VCSGKRHFNNAPSREAQGGTALSGFIASKGYPDFGSKTQGGGIGFWVNR
jgi:hypothetical protein